MNELQCSLITVSDIFESYSYGTQKKIFLIRHGESEYNAAKRDAKEAWHNLRSFKSFPTLKQMYSITVLMPKSYNSDLTRDGEKMVLKLKDLFKQANFIKTNDVQLIVHSPLIRAKRTCEGIFSKDGVAIIENNKISEMNMMEYVHLKDLKKRVSEFMDWLSNRSESCIVVVGHGIFFQELLGCEQLENCEVRKCLFTREGFVQMELIVAGGVALL